jgi:uncharacterized protein YbjT (DUF2867 family)
MKPVQADVIESKNGGYPTQKADIGTVLVTGATGYIGGQLVPKLIDRGYKVRVMVRADIPTILDRWPGVEVAVADALVMEQLEMALEGVDTAYYLIHSMLMGREEYAQADIDAAQNFREAAEKMRVRRIIYLGGLGDVHEDLSTHLRSRMDVASELMKSKVSVTVLRAAVIIGDGSASYEVMRYLVQRMPFLLVPWWARTRCQPIAVRDVIRYLIGCLEEEGTSGRQLDIGGTDVLSYEKMLKTLARLVHKKRLFIDCPIGLIEPYAYVGSLVTPVPHVIIRCLLEGSANEVVCQHNEIRDLIPITPLTYEEAVVLAMTREQQDRMRSRWSDAYPPAHELAIKLHELDREPRYMATDMLLSTADASALFKSVCSVGGNEGWFTGNWLWQLRGWIDRILLGVGTHRGRRHSTALRFGDVLDFWRVEDVQKDQRLLLRAEMKLPGKAWLEFTIDDEGEMRKLSLFAHFDTSSVFGVLYWYFCVPLHAYVFRDVLKHVDLAAQQMSRKA